MATGTRQTIITTDGQKVVPTQPVIVDEALRRAVRRMEAAGMVGEEARRAATLDLAIRRTMGEPT